SDDGLGQNNPNRSEDPWGAGCPRPDFAVPMWPPFPDSVLGLCGRLIDTKDGDKLEAHFANAGSELKRMVSLIAPSKITRSASHLHKVTKSHVFQFPLNS